MSLKIASALIGCLLAVSPVFGQTYQPITPFPQATDQPPDDTQAVPEPPRTNLLPIAVYTPAWTERWWIDGSYLMGFVRPVHVPALATTSIPGTPQAQAGVLGPGSNVLFGDRDVDGALQSGFRMDFGMWFDENRIWGFDAGFFWLSGVNQPFSASSNGSTILARPFIDAATGAQASQLIAFPVGSGPAGASSAGSINISANSGQFYGAHFDFAESIINDPNFRLKSLVGYRYLHFNDGLQIAETFYPTGGSPAPPPGTQIFSQDNFTALNTFNGAEIGLQAEWILGPFAANLLAKVAAGNIQREVNISGNTLITAPGNTPINTAGGLLALPTNSGSFDSNVFTVVPEVGLTLSWNVTSNLRLSAGYSLLVLYHAVRAADQIDTTINSSLLSSSLTTLSSASTVQRPTFALEQSNIWLQTINLGLEFRY